MPPPSRAGAQSTPILSSHTHPMMMTEYYIGLLREMRRERQARLAAIKTRRHATAYIERVQDVIAQAFSTFPKRTPLNSRVTGSLELPGCRIEKVLFESRPGCYVSANLYIPHGCDNTRRAPAVIADCGHALNGKEAIPYQNFPQRLAAAGFITLLIEPFNQGERDQYVKLPRSTSADVRDNCCNAHNMMGKQMELTGEFFGAWRAWDDIRALDYLLSRPEVDPRHVGITGNSGGGTMTTWVWPLEKRLTMAAPSCFITTFACNLENQLPADCEQYPPGVLNAGLEMADFMIARCPSPAIMMGQQLDFFDRRGLKEAYGEVRRIYDLFGAPAGHCKLFIGPSRHGYSHHNQEAMVDFFASIAGRSSHVRRLSDRQCVDSGAKLRVTPKGNVVLFGATPIYEQIAAIARNQISERKKKRPHTPRSLAGIVRTVLHLDSVSGTSTGARTPPYYRILRPHTFANYRAARYAIETEAPAGSKDHTGSRAMIRAFLQKPTTEAGVTLDVEPRITLFLPHVSAEAELNDKRLTGALIKRGTLYALDVRGLGESLPVDAAAPDFFEPYGYDYMFHGHGILFGESYLGRRVFDVLRTLDLLVNLGAQGVELMGRGQGAILAAFAGVLSPHATRITLRNAPRSFEEWATSPIVRWPAANYPRDILRHFDFPDIIKALGRRARVFESWNVNMTAAPRVKGAI